VCTRIDRVLLNSLVLDVAWLGIGFPTTDRNWDRKKMPEVRCILVAGGGRFRPRLTGKGRQRRVVSEGNKTKGLKSWADYVQIM
jgi:hypothetical protein